MLTSNGFGGENLAASLADLAPVGALYGHGAALIVAFPAQVDAGAA